jgi:hypothetical protein
MTAEAKIRFMGVFVLLVTMAALPDVSYAQRSLNQNCGPVDNLTYIPNNNATGQVFHGDGASNNGAGGWSTLKADVNQCERCYVAAWGYGSHPQGGKCCRR